MKGIRQHIMIKKNNRGKQNHNLIHVGPYAINSRKKRRKRRNNENAIFFHLLFLHMIIFWTMIVREKHINGNNKTKIVKMEKKMKIRIGFDWSSSNIRTLCAEIFNRSSYDERNIRRALLWRWIHWLSIFLSRMRHHNICFHHRRCQSGLRALSTRRTQRWGWCRWEYWSDWWEWLVVNRISAWSGRGKVHWNGSLRLLKISCAADSGWL